MENKICQIEEDIKSLREALNEIKLALDEALQLTREQMVLIERQKQIIKFLEAMEKKEEDILKVLNHLFWKVNYMDSTSFSSGFMANMLAGFTMGGR